jgi:hypothetical protein
MSGLVMTSMLWHRLGCCVTGHDYAITSDRTRMFLRCRQCGHTSPGLELTGGPLSHRRQAAPPAAAGAQAAVRRGGVPAE